MFAEDYKTYTQGGGLSMQIASVLMMNYIVESLLSAHTIFLFTQYDDNAVCSITQKASLCPFYPVRF